MSEVGRIVESMESSVLVARMVLGALFLLASITKLGSPATLSQAIERYGLGWINPVGVSIMARLLPPLEFILGASLILGIKLEVVAPLTTGLLIMFTTSIVTNLVQGRRFPCNCFASTYSEIGVGTLGRNIVLMLFGILLSVFSLAAPQAMLSFAEVLSLSFGDVIGLVVVSVSLCAMLLIIGEVDVLFRAPKSA